MMKDVIRVFFLFLALYLLTMGGHLYSPDEEILFRMTQSLAERGSLAIEPLQGFATKKGVDSKEYAQYGIGQPLLTIPFYYLGKAMASVLPAEKSPEWVADTIQYHDRTPRDVMLRLGVSIFNQTVSAMLCALLFASAFHITKDRRASWMAALLFGAGTYAWVHSKPYFMEPSAALFLFGSFFLLWRGLEKDSFASVMGAGFLYAYAVLIRMDSLFMLPGFAVVIYLSRKRQWKPYLFFSPLIISGLIILYLNKMRFGTFLQTGYEDQAEGFKFSTPILGGLYGFLFTPGKGMFWFSPPLVLFFFAFGKFYKMNRVLALGLLVCVLSFFLVQCKWQNWAGGWCWGPRHIYQIHVFLALPIALLFIKPLGMKMRGVFWAFLTFGFFVQIYGASQNFIDYYSEFFTTPDTLPNNYNAWYQESEPFLDPYYGLFIVDNNGLPIRRIPLHYVVAPIQNSIYYPQNTVWANYSTMLQMGRHDFFWVKFLTR